MAARRNEDIIFNPDTNAFLWNVNAWLDGKHHTGAQYPRCTQAVVCIDAKPVAGSMRIVTPEGGLIVAIA